MISPEQAQYFFTNTEDSVCVISASGEVLYANPSAEKLFEISSDKNIKIWKAVPFIEGNDDLIQLFIDSVTNKVASHEAIVDYYGNEGEVHNLHVRMTCYENEETVYLVVITNLTQLFKVNSALVRYTSPEIADYALTTAEGQKSGGMSKNVTIMMSDLRGFTTLSAKLGAEELIKVLNHYFEAMVAAIQKYNGTVIEFLGDGIFVIFGAPKDLPESPTLPMNPARIPNTAAPLMVLAADPPATYSTPIGLSVAQILSPVDWSTCCILPLGRWYCFSNKSFGRTARISVRAFPIPKIDFILIDVLTSQS